MGWRYTYMRRNSWKAALEVSTEITPKSLLSPVYAHRRCLTVVSSRYYCRCYGSFRVSRFHVSRLVESLLVSHHEERTP